MLRWKTISGLRKERIIVKNNFCSIKEAYNECRENERKRIIDFIAERKDEQGNYMFSKKSGADYSNHKHDGGRGIKEYGNRKERPLKPTYNLSNWKYIETCYRGQYIFISLQCFDLDPSSNNIHVLFDRIGVLFKEPENIKFENEMVSNAFLKMESTKWELPLSDEDINSLIDWIIERVERA